MNLYSVVHPTVNTTCYPTHLIDMTSQSQVSGKRLRITALSLDLEAIGTVVIVVVAGCVRTTVAVAMGDSGPGPR